MNSLVKIISILLLCICSYATCAQTAESFQSRKYDMGPKDKFLIIGKLAGKTAICFVYENESEVVLYDQQLNEDTVIVIPYLTTKHYNHKFIKTKTELCIIFEKRIEDELSTYLVRYTHNFTQIGSPVLLNKRQVNKDSEYTGYVVSDKKEKFCIYYRVINKLKDEVTFYYSTFDVQGNKLHTNQISYNITNQQPEINVAIRDNNEIHLLLSIFDKDAKQITGVLYGYGTSKIESLQALQLGEGTYHRALWHISEPLNRLVIILQSKSQGRKKSSSVYKININLTTHEQMTTAQLPLKGDVLATSKSHNGFDDFVPNKILPLQDGSILYLSEYYSYEEVNNSRYFQRDLLGMNTNNPIVELVQRKYTFGDVLCMLISNKDEIAWQRIVHKTQVTDNDEGEYSSFFVARSKASVSLLFIPNVAGTDLQQVTIKPNGELTYTLLNQLTLTDGKLLAPRSVQISENEIIVPSIGSTQLSFVKLVLP